MRTVYWLSQRLSDVPPGSVWLSEAERATEAGLRMPKRREDWRLGRWAAKRALARLRARRGPAGGRLEELARIAVLPAASGVPEAFCDGVRLPWALSISHSHGRALAAVRAEASAVGCDIERVERRSAGFLEDCFTESERDRIAASRTPELLSTLCWSAKESLMKVLGEGLRLPLPGIELECVGASPSASGWSTLRVVERRSASAFAGYWRHEPDSVLTIVGAVPFAEPVELS